MHMTPSPPLPLEHVTKSKLHIILLFDVPNMNVCLYVCLREKHFYIIYVISVKYVQSSRYIEHNTIQTKITNQVIKIIKLYCTDNYNNLLIC